MRFWFNLSYMILNIIFLYVIVGKTKQTAWRCHAVSSKMVLDIYQYSVHVFVHLKLCLNNSIERLHLQLMNNYATAQTECHAILEAQTMYSTFYRCKHRQRHLIIISAYIMKVFGLRKFSQREGKARNRNPIWNFPHSSLCDQVSHISRVFVPGCNLLTDMYLYICREINSEAPTFGCFGGIRYRRTWWRNIFHIWFS